jgi:hypothetical protein
MMPHQQLDQNAPVELQELLFERIRGLPGVTIAPSGVSVPGARAFILDAPGKQSGAFMVGGEFAHLHPHYDGSLHLMLPQADANEVTAKGWGELHPAARMGLTEGAAMRSTAHATNPNLRSSFGSCMRATASPAERGPDAIADARLALVFWTGLSSNQLSSLRALLCISPARV